MKNRLITLTLLLISVLTLFSGCIVIPRYTTHDIDPTSVTSASIYDLREGDTRYSDFLETLSPVCTVTGERLTTLIEDLCRIRFCDYFIITIAAIDPSFSYGDFVVCINYTDGSYQLISTAGFGETFDKSGQPIDSNFLDCEEEDWLEFINKYLPGTPGGAIEK